ncbi:MAG: MraY family glycosyltransferase, partial [Candidatus Cloacimonetes bacterium]|nr:MraY family glycosyltransferase [Candidatus Cloacimonadota bacterium]
MNNIYILIIIESLAIFGLTHLLLPSNIAFSKRFGIIAHPSERRIHKGSIPEAGGLCFAIPIIIAQAVFGVFFHNSDISKMLLQLSGVGVLAVLFGLWDDRYESRARLKILWQLCLSIIMYVIGYRVLYITNPLGEQFILGWAAFPATVLWFMVMLNAINLIDGMDGLASGISIIVCAVLLIVGVKEQNQLVIAISGFLLAGNAAFIRYNFFPARIFLGETGALFIGLNIAAISTAGSSQFKGITTMTLMIPLSAMAIPLIDVFLAIFRRIRIGNIFSADKAHIHHAMLD